MKYAFAFVLIALFAVIVVSHAYPQEAAAASSNDGSSAQATAEVQLTPEEEAAIEAMGGRRFWRKLLRAAVKVGGLLLTQG
ncbi:uncharacterized protein LOC118510255 [Anopheles stephensi]|uniref:Uncharacterized protein n=1 Tax=Anopheles stephensi TaxID=30069 RepID=A0A182YSZ7_ANOST|nr:uncharacterized protein LOC118510254 [Anopheles stephensi]XP_035907734.1 uncharacterized protein LOC118510255 [Anopheles stephensi]